MAEQANTNDDNTSHVSTSLDEIVKKAIPSALFLAQANLLDPSPFCRHLMLLTESSIALRLLFECGLLKPSKTIVLRGSQFPRDANDELRMVKHINEVKRAMQNGHTVVLVNHEDIFPSLYDVLNMRYTTKRNADTGKVTRMLRLAVGNRSQWCGVRDGFKIIVVVEAKDAYEKLDLPLLNRFEKQMLRAEDALDDVNTRTLLEALRTWVQEFETEIGFKEPFVGMYSQTLPSLVHYMRLELARNERRNIEFPRDLDQVKEYLLKLLSPLAQFRAGRRSLNVESIPDCDGLKNDPLLSGSLLLKHLVHSASTKKRLVVLTFSPTRDLDVILQGIRSKPELADIIDPNVIILSSVTSEHEFVQALQNRSNPTLGMKLIQCDPSLISQDIIDHARYITTSEFPDKSFTFIIHLPPGGRRRRSFNLDFQNDWDVIFIDDLVRNDFSTLMNYSPLQWADQSDNIRRVIHTKLSRALSLARPPLKQGGVLIGARERVLQFHELLDNSIFDEVVIQGAVRDYLAQLPPTTHVDMVAKGEVRGGTVTDSLILALETLILRAFAAALRWFDHDMNLFHLSAKSPPLMSRLWQLLSAQPSLDAIISSVIDMSTSTSGFVRNSGRPGFPLLSKFPWSWRVFETLDSALQGTTRGTTANSVSFDDMERILEGVIRTAFGDEVYSMFCPGPTWLIEAYINDICGFNENRRPEISLEEQTKLVISWLKRCDSRAIESLPRAHLLFRRENWSIFALLSIRVALCLVGFDVDDFSFSPGYLSVLCDFLLSKARVNCASWSDCVRTIAEHMLDQLLLQEESSGREKWVLVLLQLAHVECGCAPLSSDLLQSSSFADSIKDVLYGSSMNASVINSRAILYCKIAHDILARPGFGEVLSPIFPRVLELCADMEIERPVRLSFMKAILSHTRDYRSDSLDSEIDSSPALFSLALELAEDNMSSIDKGIYPSPQVLEAVKLRHYVRKLIAEKSEDPNAIQSIFSETSVRAFALNELFASYGELGALQELEKSSYLLRLFRAPISAINDALKAEKEAINDSEEKHPEETNVGARANISTEAFKRKGCLALFLGPDVLHGTFDLLQKNLQGDLSRFGGDEQTAESDKVINAIRTKKKAYCMNTYEEHRQRFEKLRHEQPRQRSFWFSDTKLEVLCIQPSEEFEYSHFLVSLLAAAACHTFIYKRSLVDCGAFNYIEMFIHEMPVNPHRRASVEHDLYRKLAILSCTPATEACWREILPPEICNEHMRFLILMACYTALLVKTGSDSHYLGEVLRGQGESLRKCYIPGMDDDALVQITRAVASTEYVGWWTCVNGHRYAVGECTMPMQVSRCPDCGAKIGGQEHIPVRGVSRIGDIEELSPGYYLPQLNESAFLRGLKANPLSFLHFVFHACALVGLTVKDGQRNMRRFLIPSSKGASSAELNKVCCDGLKQSLRAFRASAFPPKYQSNADHIELLFAGYLAHITRSPYRTALEGKMTDLQFPTGRKSHESTLVSLANRVGFGVMVISSIDKIQQAIGSNTNKTKILSLVGLEVASLADRLSNDTTIDNENDINRIKWRYRVPLDVAQMTHALEPLQLKYPFLTQLCTIETHLQLVTRLADIFEWVNVLNEALSLRSKRITREEASKLSNEAALETLPHSRQMYAREVLSRFCKAFNETFPLVRFLYECQRNPFLTEPDNEVDLSGRKGEGNHKEPMSFQTPISFSLSAIVQGDADAPSLCVFQLIRTLQQLNNRLLGELGTARLARTYQERHQQELRQPNTGVGDEMRQPPTYEDADLPEITMQTPRDIILSRLINYDRERDLISAMSCCSNKSFVDLEKRECSVRDINFDLLSELLKTKLIGGRHPIRVVVPTFEYAGEARRAGALAGLKARIPQLPLARTVAFAISNELDSDAQIQPLAELVDSAISFLSGASGFDGRTPLGTFLVNVLGVPQDVWEQVAPQPVKQNVCLSHLGALYTLLEEAKHGSPLESVKEIYKRPLNAEVEIELRNVAPKLNLEVLLPILHELLVSRLTESIFPEDAQLADYLEYSTDIELGSLPWFADHFPKNVVLADAFHTYRIWSEYV